MHKRVQNGNLVGSTPRSQDILQLIQCPLCLQMPKPPIYCCRAGHIVCNSCMEQTFICPTCGELYSKARNMVAEKMLEKYVMPCKYANDGCKETNLSGAAYFEHINTCDYRHVSCPSCNDGATVSYKDFLDHLVHTHGINGQISSSGSVGYNLDFRNVSGDRLKLVWPPYYYMAYKKTFLLRLVGDSKAFVCTISLIGPKSETSNYIASIKLHYPTAVPPGNSLEWRGYVTHFRDDPMDLGYNCGQGLVVPFKVIKNISSQSTMENISEWNMSVDIRKLPDPSPEVHHTTLETTDENIEDKNGDENLGNKKPNRDSSQRKMVYCCKDPQLAVESRKLTFIPK